MKFMDKVKKYLKDNRTGAWIGFGVSMLKVSGILTITFFFDSILNLGGAIVAAGLLTSLVTVIIYTLAGATTQYIIKQIL